MPDQPIQELRDLMRTRKQLVRERSQPHPADPEDPGGRQHQAQLGDLRHLGLSGRRMLEALIAGETDPNALAALAHRRIKASPAELEAALRGRVTDHHRFMLRPGNPRRPSERPAEHW